MSPRGERLCKRRQVHSSVSLCSKSLPPKIIDFGRLDWEKQSLNQKEGSFTHQRNFPEFSGQPHRSETEPLRQHALVTYCGVTNSCPALVASRRTSCLSLPEGGGGRSGGRGSVAGGSHSGSLVILKLRCQPSFRLLPTRRVLGWRRHTGPSTGCSCQTAGPQPMTKSEAAVFSDPVSPPTSVTATLRHRIGHTDHPWDSDRGCAGA